MNRDDTRDSQATGSRATRRKKGRARQASRLIAQAEWLHAHPVFWTGVPDAVARLVDAPLPLAAVLQDRLAALSAGLYAVRLDLPMAWPERPRRRGHNPSSNHSGRPFDLDVTAVDDVSPERVATTARAIEAVAKFPRAAARSVGNVNQWCDVMRRRLGDWSLALNVVDAWRAGKPGAFALDARTIWVGAATSPDAPREDAVLASAWIEERSLDPASVTADELAGLALLLAAIASVRAEPARQAGGAAMVAVACRLRMMSAAGGCEALAAWIDACRSRLTPGRFWHDALAILPSAGMAFDTRQAQAMVASLGRYSARVAAELTPIHAERAAEVRALLPAVLARGPDATDIVLRRELWVTDAGTLDAALRFIEAAERVARQRGPDVRIPMPRRVFGCEDAVVRDALLDFGAAAWSGHAADAAIINLLLDMIRTASCRPGAAPWGIALPRLRREGVFLLTRLAARPRPSAASPAGDAPVLAFFVLDVCARWVDAGFADPRRLARILCDRWSSSAEAALEWDPDHDDHNQLLVRLADGRIARLLALMRLPRAPRRHAWRGIDGWRVIEKHATALAWIAACLDRTQLAARVVRLLERIGLTIRLDPGIRAARLFAPLDRPFAPPARWPPWVGPADAEALADICRAGTIAGTTLSLPRALQRVLDLKATMAREHASLRERADCRRLFPAQQSRADRLARLLGDQGALDDERGRQLRAALPKQRALAGLAALETIVGRHFDRRWREWLGRSGLVPESAAWDNALLMLDGVSHNRRVLRRLLRHAAQDDRTWMLDLDPNRAWLDRMRSAGIRTDEWLAPRSRSVTALANVLTAYVATDPLEVLQMGSLFGTCLAADKFNAHAAVAAAVEANKRVLYVKDRDGRVLGRQLLALTGAGEVIGFTCYGAGLFDDRMIGQWVKLTLSLLALDMVRGSGTRLMPAPRLAEGLTTEDERALSLFCRGYVDTPEPFDWWIEALGSGDPCFGERDRDELRSLLGAPVPAWRDARTCPDWRREELGWEACRALLWLGPDAPLLSARQEKALGLDARHQLAMGEKG